MSNISMYRTSSGAPKKKASRGAVIFLVLFALPFAGAGTFVAYLGASMVTTWAQARSWDEVPAQVLSADLQTRRGDETTTYILVAEYRYEYRGRTYTSNTITPGWNASDNIGSFHQDRYAELRPFVGGRPFRAFVNPDDPREALLFRELRWGMLGFQFVFAAAFCLVGYGLIFAAFYGNRLAKEADELKQARPSEPWLWEKDWVDGRISAGSRGKMIGGLLFATLWNLISSPVIFLVPREWADGNRLVAIALIFPVVGAILAAYAIYAVLQWRKFGNTELELFSKPGVRGGYLEGRIHTNIRQRPNDDYKLTLTCIRKETSGSGKNRSTKEVPIWQDSQAISVGALLSGPHGASVPVRFGIPFDAGPDSDPEASTPIIWRLAVSADLPGVDYSTTFDVPVFETPDSDRNLEFEHEAPPLSEDTKSTVELEALGIVRKPTPQGGLAYVFQRARAKGPAISLTVFTTIWCGFIWVMLEVGAPIFFPIVFGLFALLMLTGIVDMWLKQTRVEINDGRLAFHKRLIGSGKTVIIESGDISRIKTKRGMQSGSKLYYQIVLRTRDGKKHALASQISDQKLAKRIIQDIEDALTAPGARPEPQPSS